MDARVKPEPLEDVPAVNRGGLSGVEVGDVVEQPDDRRMKPSCTQVQISRALRGRSNEQ